MLGGNLGSLLYGDVSVMIQAVQSELGLSDLGTGKFIMPWQSMTAALISQPVHAGLPRSRKKVWKMKFFPGQGKVREFQF